MKRWNFLFPFLHREFVLVNHCFAQKFFIRQISGRVRFGIIVDKLALDLIGCQKYGLFSWTINDLIEDIIFYLKLQNKIIVSKDSTNFLKISWEKRYSDTSQKTFIIFCTALKNAWKKQNLKIKLNWKRVKKEIRNRQGSNLRGQSPLDFKSNALTTRPRLLLNI